VSSIQYGKRLARYRRKYTRLCLAVLPITPPVEGEEKSGKSPAVKHGYKDAEKRTSRANKLFEKHPEAGIAIATGPRSGVIVLDVDTKTGGQETLAQLEKELGPLPQTWTVKTSNGGSHRYFQWPKGLEFTRDSAGKIFGRGIDVLGHTSYAIAPPSRHWTGVHYEWKDKCLLDRSPAELPKAWLARILERARAKTAGPSRDIQSAASVIRDGHRNEALFHMGCGYRAGGDDEETLRKRLGKLNARRCVPPLDDGEIRKLAANIAKQYAPDPKKNLPQILAMSTLADRFACGEHLLFHAGQFYEYGETHWSPMAEELVRKAVLDQIEDLEKQADLRVSLIGEAVSYLRIKCVTTTDPFGEVSQLRPIVNCQNGEVWLEAGGRVRLRKHRPNSGQLHCLPVVYDPDATCPEYDAALERIFSKAKHSDSLIRHWHELVGYIVQPARNRPVILVLLGEGGNGKTKLAETIMQLLGRDLIYSGRLEEIDSNRFAIGALRGKLLFLDDDLRARIRLPDGVLKRLSEQKTVTGEEKFKQPVTFTLRALPMILCNNIPLLQDISHGMKRRLQVIPFDKTFDGADNDITLFDRITANELPGVLNRALEGWKRLQERGHFKIPPDVQATTEKWIGEANPFTAFIEEAIERDPDGRTPLGVVFEHFLQWTKDVGIQRPLNRLQFRRDLKHQGFDVRKSNGDVVVRGIILRK